MSAGNQATPQAAFGFTRHGNEKSKSAKRGICASKLEKAASANRKMTK